MCSFQRELFHVLAKIGWHVSVSQTNPKLSGAAHILRLQSLRYGQVLPDPPIIPPL